MNPRPHPMRLTDEQYKEMLRIEPDETVLIRLRTLVKLLTEGKEGFRTPSIRDRLRFVSEEIERRDK